MIGVYSIKNLVTGEMYIGRSNNIQRRFSEHKYGGEHNKRLSLDFKKYGLDNFSFDVIEECPLEKLDEREIYWIKTLKPGYNKTKGGIAPIGYKHTEETKKKLSRISKAVWESKSEEEKRTIIERCLTGPKLGHIVSKETREKLRLANLGKKQSPETIRKRIESSKWYVRTNEKCKKPIICVETGEKFDSLKQAKEKYGLTTLSGHLKGKYKTCKGKHYRYL